MSKPKIAFFDFTSCEGCQLTVVDLLQTHLGLLDLVEIVEHISASFSKRVTEQHRVSCSSQSSKRFSSNLTCQVDERSVIKVAIRIEDVVFVIDRVVAVVSNLEL